MPLPLVCAVAVVLLASVAEGAANGCSDPGGWGWFTPLVAIVGTVITGVTVAVLGRLAQIYVVDPIQEQRKVLGEIDYSLTYLAQWYANPFRFDEMSKLPDYTLTTMTSGHVVVGCPIARPHGKRGHF
jgi:hypothetical protein